MRKIGLMMGCLSLLMLLSACAVDEEYGMCSGLGLCPPCKGDDCDNDDDSSASAKKSGGTDSTPDHSIDHSPQHDDSSQH